MLAPELFEAPLLSRERSTACSVIEGARVRIGLAFVLLVRILCPLLTLPVGAGRLILLLRLGGCRETRQGRLDSDSGGRIDT